MGEYWWSAILEGEEHIDINQINKERSMATVGEEEHAVLDRLTFDYRQKLQGKPQSHELVWPQQWVGAGGWGKAVQLAAGPPVQAALNGRAGCALLGALESGHRAMEENPSESLECQSPKCMWLVAVGIGGSQCDPAGGKRRTLVSVDLCLVR